MGKYYFKVSGEYNIDVKMKKDDIILHDGSVLTLISITNTSAELNLNYGKRHQHPYELKKIEHLIISVPMKDYLYRLDYQYIPLIFESEEFLQLMKISYIDKCMFHYIPQISMTDIFNLFAVRFRLEHNIIEMLSFKNIIDSIIASSEGSNHVITYLQSFLHSQKIHLRKLNGNLTEIALFIDISDKIYEWNTVYKVGKTYYLEIADKYAIEIS